MAGFNAGGGTGGQGPQGPAGPAGTSGAVLQFESTSARDTFFTANLSQLKSQLPIAVTTATNTVSLQVWTGATSPGSYDNTLWRAASIRSSTGSFELDQAITISAGGENVVYTSNASMAEYHPLWQNYNADRAGALARIRETASEHVIEPTTTDNLTNPDFTVTIASLRVGGTETGQTIHWAEVEVDASSVLTNWRGQTYLNGVLFFEQDYATVTPTANIVRLNNAVPIDVMVGDSFRVVLTSPDGNVVLKGDSVSGRPYYNLNVQLFDDKEVGLREDAGLPAPGVSGFSIQGQATHVDAGTTLSGSKTFEYTVSNPSRLGNGTIAQNSIEIATGIDPTSSSTVATITTQTLNAGETATFGISFPIDGGGTVTDTFTVTGRQQAETLYYGALATDTSATVDPATLSVEQVISGSQFNADFDIPVSGFAVIISPADRDISSIIERTFNVEVLGDFTKVTNARTINSQQYDTYVHQNNAQTQGVLATTITVG